MKLALNQPYFVPYLGYWQLIHAADTFVLADDYNYIVRGWINRNRILINGRASYFNLEIEKASLNRKINELLISDVFNPIKKLRQIELAYRKAPFFNEGMQVIENIITYSGRNLADFLEYSIYIMNDYLNINTNIVRSSDYHQDSSLKREYRIYDFCEKFSADTYINAAGGNKLYVKEEFQKRGLNLQFLKMNDITYTQFGNEFLPSLSIIDVIMFNDRLQVHEMLNMYHLE